MIDHRLERWVILLIKSNLPDTQDHYRVLGGVSGGYIHGDSWRMNSGIERIERIGDSYLIHGTSGSIYQVPVGGEGLANSFSYIYAQLREHAKKSSTEIDIVPMEDVVLLNHIDC